ncbi:MAG: hypothetical protein FJ221_07435 [Lentisphaerae bacterium]|nr:hypothetical protein [Lentisphaerota bacterium]
MNLTNSIRLSGWFALAMAVTVGCEDFTRLPEGQTATTSTAQATRTNATAAATTPVAATPSPSGSLGVTGAGGGFLWKPVSESRGTLVVLLPETYTGGISTVFIAESNGTVVEVGSYRGNYNGNRAHYDFTMAGGGYGTGIYVVADLEDGTTVNWYIADGSSRTQY